MSRFTAPQQRVAHERVEDEVIAINLATGTYFSLRDSAADVWTLLMQGSDAEGVTLALAEVHGQDATVVRADVRAFIEVLLDHGLVVEDLDAPAQRVSLHAPSGTYHAPEVETFDDMEELLLLDPIHEVDDAGWPVLPVEPHQ